MLVLEQTEDIQTFKFLVCYSGYAGIELLGGQFVHHFDAVLVFNNGRIGPGVVDGDVKIVFFQSFVNVDDLGVAHIRAVLLEGEAEDENVAVDDLNAFLLSFLFGVNYRRNLHN